MTPDPDDHAFLYYRSPSTIRNEAFTHRMRGLDEDEVREYLALLADQVAAAEHERAELHAEIDRLREENALLRRTAEARRPDDKPQAAAVLSHAQAVADQLVEEAVRHTRRVMAHARAQEREVLRRAAESAMLQLRAVFEGVADDLEQLGDAVTATPDYLVPSFPGRPDPR
jgi:DivIVA domain-containing protein